MALASTLLAASCASSSGTALRQEFSRLDALSPAALAEELGVNDRQIVSVARLSYLDNPRRGDPPPALRTYILEEPLRFSGVVGVCQADAIWVEVNTHRGRLVVSNKGSFPAKYGVFSLPLPTGASPQAECAKLGPYAPFRIFGPEPDPPASDMESRVTLVAKAGVAKAGVAKAGELISTVTGAAQGDQALPDWLSCSVGEMAQSCDPWRGPLAALSHDRVTAVRGVCLGTPNETCMSVDLTAGPKTRTGLTGDLTLEMRPSVTGERHLLVRPAASWAER